MAKNKNAKNDWIATMLASPEAVSVDFLESGINPGNTTMDTKDEYKKMSKIQEIFTDPETNKFNDDKFNTFYDHAVYGYNDLVKKAETDNVLDNIKYYDNQVIIPKGSKVYKSGAYLERTLNPDEETKGIFATNQIEKGKLSVRELAQKNDAKDFKTGENLGYKPNDSIFTALFKEPLVIASWDEDGEHIDQFTGKEVEHFKGQQKLDENGRYFYENLGGRSIKGKELLNLTDTLTEDGSWANKYDFTDSDGLEKNISGSVLKAAFSIAPYFIPHVKTAYTLYNIGLELSDAIPSLTKAVGGLTGSDLDNLSLLNNIQSKARQLKNVDVSDYARNNMIGSENIMGIVSSSFGQLSSQRMIASIPSKIGASKKEVTAFHKIIEGYLGKKQADAFKLASYDDQLGVLNQLKDKIPAVSSFMKKLDFWNNTGSRSISSAYMAITSATQSLEDAKEAGLDDQDASMYYMGNAVGLYSIFRHTDVGNLALKGLGLDDINRSINKVVKERSAEALKPFTTLANATAAAKGVVKEEQKKGLRLLNIFNSAKTNSSNIAKKIIDLDLVTNPYAFAALSEGIEEVSEEMLADGLKIVHNGLNKAGLTSSKKGTEFNFSADDMIARYGMSFFGGAIGGAIFHANTAFAERGIKKVDKDLLWLVRNGYKNDINNKINKLKDKSAFGSSSLTPQVYSAENFKLDEDAFIPATKKEDSQNDVIANMLLHEVNYIDNILQQNDIPEDKFLNEIYSKRIDDIMDLGLNSALLDDANELAMALVDDQANINSIPKPADTASNEEKSKYEQAVRKKQAVMDGHRMELQDIINGKSLPKYFKEAYFSTHGNINKAFGIKDINDFSKSKYNKFYKELGEDEKSEVQEDYQAYLDLDRRKQLQVGLKRFEQLEEQVLKSKNKLAAIEENKIATYNDIQDDELEIRRILEEGGDEEFFMDKFNPNFGQKRTEAYSNLRIRQLAAKNQDINFSDYSFDIEYKNLNDAVEKEYESLGFKNINGSYFKRVIKAKQLKENIGAGSLRVTNELIDDNSVDKFIKDPVITQNDLNAYGQKIALEMESADSEQKVADLNNKKNRVKEALSRPVAEYTQDDVNVLKSEGFSNETINQYQEVLNQKDKITNYIEKSKIELNDNLRVTPFLDILRESAISAGENDVARSLNLIQKYQEKLNENNVDLSKFIISNQIELKQLNKIKELIEQLNVVTDSLTEDNSTKGIRRDTTFGTASNIVLKKNGFDSPYDGTLLSQDQRHRLLTEANRMYYQIGFMQELSKFNQGDKIGYDKSISIAYKLNSISALLPNGMNSIFNTIDFIKEEDLLDPEVNEAVNYLTIKSDILVGKLLDNATASRDIDLTDEEVSEFEKNILKVEKFIYNKFQSLEVDKKKDFIDKLFIRNGNRTALNLINELKEKIQNTTDPIELNRLNDQLEVIYSDIKLKVKEDLDDKQDALPTKFNSTLDNLNNVDINSYLLEIVSNPPQGFFVMLKGDSDADGSDFSKTPYAPLQIQETLMRKTFNLVSGNSNEFSPLEYYYSKFIEDYFDDNAKNVIYSNVFETGIKTIGISGTGKTISISTLARIFENDNKNILLYSPIQKVSENLRSIVGERSNVLNGKEGDSRIISELSRSILGDELYNEGLNQIKTEAIKATDKPNDKSNEESVVLRIVKNGERIFKLNKNNPKVKEAISKIKGSNLYRDASVIVIDEYTHLNPIDLDLLELTIRDHNSNLKPNQNKLSVVFIGDDSQEGFLAPINGSLGSVSNIVCHTAPKMTDMIRAGYNVKIDNVSSLLSLQNSIFNIINANQNDKKGVSSVIDNNHITLGYVNNPDNGIIGEKISNNITQEDLELIVSKIKGKIGAIVSNTNGDLATKILNLPESLRNKIQIIQHNNVQGSEYDFTIIDVEPMDYDEKEPWSGLNAIKQFYTLISRSKQGSLITSSSVPKGLYITSSDANIDDSKASLDEDSINEYKEFRENVLDAIIKNELYTKPKKASPVFISNNLDVDSNTQINNITTSQPGDTDVRPWNIKDLVRAFELSSLDASTTPTDTKKKVTKDGSLTAIHDEFNEDKLFMYTFHERRSINNGVPDALDLNGYALSKNEKNKKTAGETKENLDVIKRSILANLTLDEAKGIPITSLADSFKYGVLDDYNIDFSNFDLTIESRLVDDVYTRDNSYINYNTSKKDDDFKVISFINARFKTNDGGDAYFTLAALPNLNNENVLRYESVKDRLMSIEKDFYDYAKKINQNPNDTVLVRKINISNAKELSGLTFHRHKNKSEDITFSEFRSKNENKLKISEPYIIANYNVIGNMSPDKREKAGRPFVIISNNPTVDTTELLDRYQNKIISYNKSLDSGVVENLNNDTYLMFLHTKKIPFTSWMNEVHQSVNSIINGGKPKDNFRILEHESQSAKLLTNMVNNIQWLNWSISQPRNKRKDYQNKVIDNILTNYYKGSINESQLSKVVEDIYTRIYNVLNLNKSLDREFFKNLNTSEKNTNSDKLNAVNEKLVATINAETSSIDVLEKSGIYSLLNLAYEKDDPSYRLFSSYSNIKKYKFTAILEAMIYGRNYQGSTSKGSTKSKYIGTDFDTNFELYNMLVSENMFNDSEKEVDSMVYVQAISANKAADSINNPFAIKCINDESDFIMSNEIITSSIYMELNDIDIEPINESDAKSFQQKIEIKKTFNDVGKTLLTIGIDINRLGEFNSIEEGIEKINKSLEGKISVLNDAISFNIKLNDNLEIIKDDLTSVFNKDDQNEFMKYEDYSQSFNEIDQTITLKVKDNGIVKAIYEVDLKTKTFTKTEIVNPNVSKNSNILDIFANSLNLDDNVKELLNEIDKNKDSMDFINNTISIVNQFGMNVSAEYNGDQLNIKDNIKGIERETYIPETEIEKAYNAINSLPLDNTLKDGINGLIKEIMENTVVDSLKSIDDFIDPVNLDLFILNVDKLNEKEQADLINNLEKIFEMLKC